jgi:uncharacterized protein
MGHDNCMKCGYSGLIMRLPLTLWIVTDGNTGNFNPALGLAEAIHSHIPCTILRKDLAARGLGAVLPPQILLRTHYVSLYALQKLYKHAIVHTGEPLPDVVIGNGRVAVPVVAALKREAQRMGHRMVAIQLQNPCVPSTLFDLVIAPRHDLVKGDNVLHVTGSLTRITNKVLTDAAANAPEVLLALPRPRIAVLIGGKSKSHTMTFLITEQLTRDIEALRARVDGSLMLTASRRTEPEHLHFLKTAFMKNKRAYFWDGRDHNPYFSFLALADAVVVTGDSVNMLSD